MGILQYFGRETICTVNISTEKTILLTPELFSRLVSVAFISAKKDVILLLDKKLWC